MKRLLATYERAIETKDLALFRSVKPNLTGDEERRLRKAFESTKTQEVTITVAAVELPGEELRRAPEPAGYDSTPRSSAASPRRCA